MNTRPVTTKLISTRMNIELLDKIKKLADEGHRPFSNQLELMLTEWLEAHKKIKH
jgi:hypothetical protein